MSAEPPPSQAYPGIFLYQPNVQIPVFVEASGIQNRPKLIRSLRNSGALICHDPAAAHVILVDSSTIPGIKFLRDWGTDPAKSVLEYGWARRSIEAGRALLQNDNWGDCIASDDGREIREDEHENESENPLPTPRPTPSDTGRRISPVLLQNSTGNLDTNAEVYMGPSSSQSPSQIQPPPPFSQTPQTLQQPQTPSHPQQHQQNYPQFSQQLQPYQQPQYFTHNAVGQFTSPFSATPVPQQPNSHFPQIFQNHTGLPPNHIFQEALVQLMNNFQQQNPISMPTNVAQQTAFLQQLLQGASSTAQFGGTPQWAHNPHVSNVNDNHEIPQASISTQPQSSSPQPLAPSIRRRRSPLPSTPSPPPPPSRRRKGKERAEPSRRDSFKRKRSEPTEDEDDGFEETPATPEYSPKVKSQVLSPRNLGEIFRTEAGESLVFFVQVDLTGRHDIVRSIKKNGGKMVGDIREADYVVLGNTLSKTFNGLLAQTNAANKPPLRANFIIDCIEQEALLDIDNYILDTPSHPNKRIRTSGVVKVETDDGNDIRELKKLKKVKQTPSKAKMDVSISRTGGTRSPTPPPSHNKVERSPGIFAFTDEENKYLKRYIRYLVEGHVDISHSAICKQLYQKMPHHSSLSWQSHLKRNFPDVVDLARKKVGIAQRKAESNDARANQSRMQAGPSHLPAKYDDSMNRVEATAQSDIVKQDFDTICDFFARGESGSDSGEDEAVWAALTLHQPCRSAASWPEFFTERETEIKREIEIRVDAYGMIE